ncbi:MAG: hypothetical protein ACFB9N_05005 [Geitlerinemataceae cyanobacterium]
MDEKASDVLEGQFIEAHSLGWDEGNLDAEEFNFYAYGSRVDRFLESNKEEYGWDTCDQKAVFDEFLEGQLNEDFKQKKNRSHSNYRHGKTVSIRVPASFARDLTAIAVALDRSSGPESQLMALTRRVKAKFWQVVPVDGGEFSHSVHVKAREPKGKIYVHERDADTAREKLSRYGEFKIVECDRWGRATTG